MYLARLEVKGLGDLLLMDPKDVPKTPSSVTKEERLRKNNLKAYSDLITCMDIKKPQGKAAMRLIVASKSSDYPRGNAPQAWKNLLRKFAPTTTGELNKVKQDYVNARMRKYSNPDAFIDYMER